MSTEQQRRYWRLTSHVKTAMSKAGLDPARYDADYLVGAVMEWLAKEDAALTGRGVRKFRR